MLTMTTPQALNEMCTKEELMLIARKEKACPICNGERGYRYIPDLPASVRRRQEEYMDCQCLILQTWWQKFSSAIGRHDQFADLRTLQPSDKSGLSMERQEKILTTLRGNPKASYAFFGPAGTSKSTFCAALYRKVLMCSLHSTWHVSAHTLMEEFHADAMGKETEGGRRAPIPSITINKIKSAVAKGQTPRLFLEEIDKVKWSEFKTNHLFRIIDGIYQHKGQLVLNTNLTPEQFEGMFSPETGPAIARRVVEMCKIYDFFPKASS